jgi:PIN domain nuclease of toxin-antitoxin system
MKYLVDTHILIWLMVKPELVGVKTRDLLLNDDSIVYFSHASLWELELKYNKGRFPHPIDEIIKSTELLGALGLAITLEHIKSSTKVGIEHTDPFDLMLCAQAKSEGMTLVTADRTLLEGFADSIDAKL